MKSLVVLKPLNAANSLLVFALDAVKLQNLDMEKLDKLDRLILGQLQADGRATYDQKLHPRDLFRASVQTWPEVVECDALSGEMDYFLRVVVRDMGSYSNFVMTTLLKHPSVQDCKTSFVLDRIKATTALPL